MIFESFFQNSEIGHLNRQLGPPLAPNVHTKRASSDWSRRSLTYFLDALPLAIQVGIAQFLQFVRAAFRPGDLGFKVHLAVRKLAFAADCLIGLSRLPSPLDFSVPATATPAAFVFRGPASASRCIRIISRIQPPASRLEREIQGDPIHEISIVAYEQQRAVELEGQLCAARDHKSRWLVGRQISTLFSCGLGGHLPCRRGPL